MNKSCPTAAQRGCRSPRNAAAGLLGILVAVVGLGGLLLAPSAARGQNFGAYPGMAPSGRFIEPPRSVRQVLSDAERAIQSERYSDAVLGLGDLLAREPTAEGDADLAGQDFFLDAGEGTERASRSLFREAEAMLGRMPPAALEIYELRYGPTAAQLAEQAAAAKDRALLRDVSRRFFHTAAGYEATLLLGYLELTEGRPVAATAVLRRLAAQPRAAERFGDPLQLTLAEAEHLAGLRQNPDRSAEQRTEQRSGAQSPYGGEETPAARGRRPRGQQQPAGEQPAGEQPAGQELGGGYGGGGYPGALQTPANEPGRVLRGKVAGKPVEVSAGDAADEWLENTFGRLDAAPPEAVGKTLVAGGGPSRSGSGGGHIPLSGVRWMLPTTSSQRQERTLVEFTDSADNSNEAPAPTWQPIVAAGQLLMRTTERMVAVDFDTGKRVWEYPWSGDAARLEDGALEVDAMDNEEAARDLLIQRVWNDLPYGRISSDGERVYLLTDLGELAASRTGAMGFPVRMNSVSDPSANTLVALDLRTEGKLLWMRGKQETEPAEHGLAEAFFLGPPLPVDGALYQIADLAGDTYLLCLDPATGSERWRQQLIANEGSNIASDPVRRIGGAMPAYRDGILVCPTGAGAVVALDLASRTLLWGNHYPRGASNVGYPRGARGGSYDQSMLLRRWLDGTPIIADGCVLVSPVESDQLHGFDLLTGQPLWSPMPRDDFRYVAGVRDGRFLLVSPAGAQAYHLRSGRPAWATPLTLANDESVVGTGVFGDGVYLLPTAGQRILEIDLETGEVVRRRETAFPLGNLLATDDSVVSQDATTLAVAYAEEPLLPRVEERLSTDANDLWAMLRRSELLLQQGKRSEAIEWLLRARQQDAGDEEVRVLLVQALLESIREGESPHPEAAALLDELVELTPQRVELLRLQVDSAIGDKAPQTAVEHLIALSQIVLREEQTMRARQPRQIAAAENLRTSLDSWLAARLAIAVEMADQAQREEIEQKIAAHVTPLQTETPPVRRRLLRQFGRSPATDRVRGGIFDAARDGGSLADAERWALDALVTINAESGIGADLQTADPANERRLVWQSKLADLYARTGFGEDAKAVVEAMEAAGPLSGADEELRQRTAALTEPHVWPPGVRLQVRDDVLAQQMQRRGRRTLTPIHVVSRRGETMAGWQPLIDQQGTIILRDPQGMDHVIPFDGGRVETNLTQAAIDHGLMILLTPQELVGIDLFALGQGTSVDAVLWRRPWRTPTVNSSTRSRSAPEFLGDNRRNYIYSSGQAGADGEGVMRLGPIVGRRFFLLQGHELIALDAVTNEELWRSGGFADDAYVVADDASVAVVSVDEGVQVLRSQDGGRIRRDDWEPNERIHLAAGRHLLTSQNEAAADGQPARRIVRLRNPIDGEVVLTATLESPAGSETPAAYGRILDGRLMAILTAEGRALVWDLDEGREIADAEVNAGGEVSGIQAILWDEAILISATRSEDRTVERPGAAPSQTQWGEDHVEVDGPIHAISLEDGAVRWSYELDAPWGVTRNQPGGSPLLILTRATQSFPNGGRRVNRLDLLAIDTRDGSLAARVEAMDIESNVNDINTESTISPAANTVDVRLSHYGFLFEFTDEVLPEEQRVTGTEAVAEQLEQSRSRAEARPALEDIFEAPARPVPVR